MLHLTEAGRVQTSERVGLGQSISSHGEEQNIRSDLKQKVVLETNICTTLLQASSVQLTFNERALH